MTQLTRASDGHSFTFGQTTLYVGPGPRGSRGPVLAFVRPGVKKPTIVATFNSASTAEKFVDALRTAVDELTPAPQPLLEVGDPAPGTRSSTLGTSGATASTSFEPTPPTK